MTRLIQNVTNWGQHTKLNGYFGSLYINLIENLLKLPLDIIFVYYLQSYILFTCAITPVTTVHCALYLLIL